MSAPDTSAESLLREEFRSSSPDGQRHAGVLLVDDRAANLLALEALLEPLIESHGIRMVSARSGDEALRHVLLEDFAVILLDVQMPGIDGVETARLIKARSSSRHTPIIFLTAIDRDRRRVTEGYLSGAVDYLTKPFDPDMLRAKVVAFVELYQKRAFESWRARRRYADHVERAAQALETERARLVTVLEQLPIGVIIAEAPSGRVVHMNAAVHAIMGHETPSESIADYSASWRGRHPDGRELANEEWPLARVLQTGEPVTGQLVAFVTPDGREVTVTNNAAPVHDAEGQLVAAVVVFDDITERRRAQERLTRLHEVTTALAGAITVDAVASVLVSAGMSALGGAGGALALVDSTGSALEVVASSGFGSEIVRRWQHVPLASPVPLADAVRAGLPVLLGDRAARDQRYPDLAAEMSTAGHQAWAAVPIAVGDRVIAALAVSFNRPRAFDDGEIALLQALAGQAAIALERARAFEAERRARAQAETASRAKSQFLATMSHELRTPLNAIRGYAQLIEMGVRGPVTEEMRADLRRIQQSERHLLGIISEILEYARLDAGRAEFEPVEVPLAAIVEEATGFVAPQLQSRAIVYVSEVEPGATAWADADKLRQIVVNLLSNAIKATSEGGRIEVACVLERDDAVLRVSDTGTGIPAEKLESIFEPFVQLGRELHHPIGGTGLGLAISRELARGMGGDVTVESEVGVGSTFVVRLPRRASTG